MFRSTVYDPVRYGLRRSIYIKTQVMKTISTLIFVLFIGVSAQARTADGIVRLDAVEMTGTVDSITEEVSLESTTEMARLYKRIDTRVKKELTFSTKANSAKTA